MALEKEKRLAEKMASKVKLMQQRALEKEQKAQEKDNMKYTEKQLERQNQLWEKMRGERNLVEQEKKSIDKALERNQKRMIRMQTKGKTEKGESWKGSTNVGEGIKLAKLVRMEDRSLCLDNDGICTY